MRRIRVIHLCNGLQMGGMEKLLVEFARHADRDRFDLEFVALTTKGIAGRQIESMGSTVHALEQPPGVRLGLPLLLARLFSRNGTFSCGKADVVHTHNTKPLLYGAPAARLAGVPCIIHTRHGQRHGANRRQTLLFNLAARRVDHIVSVSRDSTRLAEDQGLSADRLATIHNGIDVASFEPTGPRAGGPALFLGRLSPEKDIATLLAAAAIAAAEEPAFRLHIAGAGAMLSELQRLATDLNLGDHVVFLGESRDAAATLATAGLFVLPSLTEGISLALLEAMALGLPAVATSVGGNVEVVVDGQTGLLVPPRSPEELAQAMLRIHRQPELGRTMGQAGRKLVETDFDSRRMVQRYESLYCQTLGQGTAAPAAA